MKFDAESGTVKERYRSDPGNPSTLSDDRVMSLAKDKSGFIWIGTDDGLNRFNPASGEFTQFLTKPQNPLATTQDRIWGIYPDPVENALWICTDTKGLYRYDTGDGKFQRYSGDATDKSGLRSSKVLCAFRDRSGVLWVGTEAGLYKNDPSRIKFVNYEANPADRSGISSNNVYKNIPSSTEEGFLWIATYGRGLETFNEKTGSFTHFRADPSKKEFSE